MSESYHEEVAEVIVLIDKATSDHLVGPEWHINLMISDMANEKSVVCDDIVHKLQRQLQSGSPRVALLTLFVAETLVKNGTSHVHQSLGSRTFLNEVAAVTDGSMGTDVQNKALELIKQWADAFAGTPLTMYQDTYRTLKIQGAVFPEVENDVPVFTPPPTYPSSTSHTSNATSQASTSTRAQQVAKLNGDLQVVAQKITLYRELRASHTPFSAESMVDVLDFLRQCQPRMNTLIEGGIMGKLDERTLEQCLNVNDNLIKVLEDAHEATKTAPDMIRFESPKRHATSNLLDSVSSLNIQQPRLYGSSVGDTIDTNDDVSV